MKKLHAFATHTNQSPDPHSATRTFHLYSSPKRSNTTVPHCEAVHQAESIITNHARSKSRFSMLSHQKRALLDHEEQIAAIWYQDQQKSLEIALNSRRIAMREQLNHWLQQNGFALRGQTTIAALQEARVVETEIMEYWRNTYARASELLKESHQFADAPAIQQRYRYKIEEMLEHSEQFVDQLMHHFQNALREKI